MANQVFRTRWAALGAAVAVSLGAGGIGITQATTSSGEMPIYVPIEPCRLADTRPGPQVGPRGTPIGADESYLLSGWGTVGECTLPTGTTGLSLNVTAIRPTLPTFLTLYPGDGALPNASHLNPVPGQPPTPNAVNVDLDSSGEFNVYNLQGSVDIMVDVVGYYDDHEHSSVDLTNEPGVASNFSSPTVQATKEPTAMIATSIRVPSDGWVLAQVTGNRLGLTGGFDEARCQLQRGTIGAIDFDQPWFSVNDPDITVSRPLSAHRVMPIAVADNPRGSFTGQAISLVCQEPTNADEVAFGNLHISATFFPTSYAPPPLSVAP